MKKSLFKLTGFGIFCLLLTACSSAPSSPKETQPATKPLAEKSAENSVVWQDYTNPDLGFSMKVPQMVLSNYIDPSSLVTLNVFEDKGTVYFTVHPLEETIRNISWDFRIGGTTVKSADEIVPFLESYYGVKGCKVEMSEDKETGLTHVPVSAKQEGLMPDDPMACFIGGKVATLYDEKTGKLITYNLFEPFFYEPGKSVGEEALTSLQFNPSALSEQGGEQKRNQL